MEVWFTAPLHPSQGPHSHYVWGSVDIGLMVVFCICSAVWQQLLCWKVMLATVRTVIVKRIKLYLVNGI